MSKRNRAQALVLACLVATLALSAPALAARHTGRSGSAAAISNNAAGESSGWLDRAWSWLTALFGEENGNIVP